MCHATVWTLMPNVAAIPRWLAHCVKEIARKTPQGLIPLGSL